MINYRSCKAAAIYLLVYPSKCSKLTGGTHPLYKTMKTQSSYNIATAVEHMYQNRAFKTVYRGTGCHQ